MKDTQRASAYTLRAFELRHAKVQRRLRQCAPLLSTPRQSNGLAPREQSRGLCDAIRTEWPGDLNESHCEENVNLTRGDVSFASGFRGKIPGPCTSSSTTAGRRMSCLRSLGTWSL